MAVPTQCRCMEHTAFFPVGRGADYAGEVLSGGECREVVEMINCLYKNLSCDKPELDFHYLMPGHKKVHHNAGA